MFPSALLTEVADVIPGGVGLANSGGIAGRYVNMSTYERVAVCIYLKPGTGTDRATVTLKQAKDIDNSPPTEKALAFTKAGNVADASDSTQLVVEDITGNQALTSDAAKEQLIVIDVAGADLDVENGFDCIRADVSDPGSNSTPCSITYLCYPRKYGDFPGADLFDSGETILPLD